VSDEPGIGFHGAADGRPVVRVGMIGCGSHGWRNIVPALHFTPLRLTATCDLDLSRAEAWAAATSAVAAYDDHRTMLERSDLDAVIVVTGYDERGRPRYPDLAVDCLEAGLDVWIEKPPAATVEDIDRMAGAAERAGRHVMVGLKKMFAPANRKARELITSDDFGRPSLTRLEYPQRIPTPDEMRRYLVDGEANLGAITFLDHLCHPASVLLLLLGPPTAVHWDRTRSGAGVASFDYADGSLATLSLTWGGASLDGLERTVITSDRGRHVVVENNMTVEYHRMAFTGYGDVTDFYAAAPNEATAVWRPEVSLGQLYNKGLFMLGYWGELDEFAAVVRERRPPVHGDLDEARVITSMFSAFAQPAGTVVSL
jgi:predicted dehydrogenase